MLRLLAITLDRSDRGAAAGKAGVDDDVWESFVSGGWGLVDAFEANGRRYFVARRSRMPGARPLSSKQREIARRLARGEPSKVIAMDLGISASTLAHHTTVIAATLGARSRVELVSFLRRLGAHLESDS